MKQDERNTFLWGGCSSTGSLETLALWIAYLGLIIALQLMMTNAAHAQSSSEETAKTLIVMVESTLGGSRTLGAGIIFGIGDDRLYIATANHVVRRGPSDAAEILVSLPTRPGEQFPAQLLAKVDRNLDLAVLGLLGLRHRAIQVDKIPFGLLGRLEDLERGDSVRHIGNPSGNSWRVNVSPDLLESFIGDELRFETSTIAPGSSGGGLFNDQYELIGMVTSDRPPVGVATDIGTVIKRLEQWGFEVSLGASTGPELPRDTVLIMKIHRVAVLAAHCNYGDNVSVGYGYQLIHSQEMFLGSEMRPGIEHRFRNAEKILVHVADCEGSGSYGNHTVATTNDAGKGILSKQVKVGRGVYEVDYSVVEVERPLGGRVSFPFEGRRFCEIGGTSISECYDSRGQCEERREDGLGVVMGYECRRAPDVAYCFEYGDEGDHYASCHTTPTACEGELGGNAEALTRCMPVQVRIP